MLSFTHLSLAASLFLLSPCLGQTVIRVDKLVNGSWVQFGSDRANGSDFTIADTDGSTYQVYSVPLQAGNAAIGTITITSSGTLEPALLIGQDVFAPFEPTESDQLFVEGAVTLGGVAWSGGKPKLQVFVTGDITGEVKMYHIVRIDTNGDIKAKISHEATGTNPPRLGRIRANALTDAVTAVNSKYGDIHIIETTGGIIEGDVIAENGSITNRVQAATDIRGKVLAPLGSIQDVIAGANISGALLPLSSIQAKNGIHLVQAGFDIYADITANGKGGNGAIGGIRNTSRSPVS